MTTEASGEHRKKFQADDSIDFTGLMLDYFGNWKWFVACAIISCMAAYMIYSSKSPVYNVSASIYLNDDTQKTSRLALNASPEAVLGPSSYIDETEIEILKSRNNIVNIVDTLGLAYSYYVSGTFKDEPVYGTNPVVAEMDPIALNGLKNQIKILINKSGDEYKVRLETKFNNVEFESEQKTPLPAVIETPHGDVRLSLSQTAARFDGEQKILIRKPINVAQSIANNLQIEYAANSMTIIRIKYSTPVIAMGEDIIRELLNLYNMNMIEDKNRSAVQTEEFILDRLVMISSELKDVEQRLENYRREHNISTSLENQAAIYSSKSDATAEQLTQIDVQLQILDEVNDAVATQNDGKAIALVCEDAELNSMIEAYNKKIAQLQRTLETVTDDNPLVIKMQDDIAREKSRLIQAIRSVKNNILTRRRAISSRNKETSGHLASVPTIDKGLQEIFREQQVKVNIYTFLLQRREEIALQKALATPTAQLIDSPLGSGPISPRLFSHMGVGLLLGLLLPALVIFLRRLFFPVFKDKTELKRATDITILGEIAHSKDSDSGIIVRENSDDSCIELFRLLRANIDMVLSSLGKDKKVVLITSTISGEGKSFCVANIAATFAIKGKKVLIIGADVRRPTLHRLFKISREPGLTNYLMGACNDYRELIKTHPEIPGLDILTTGPIPPNPNEIISNGKIDQIIEQARNEYDIIFIDSAPIGIISDTLSIAGLSDIQIYVTRANFTKQNCLNILAAEIENGRFSHCYLILNDVDLASNSYSYRKYGRYGSYGSGYGYRR